MTERMNYHVRVINKDDSVQEYDCSFYSVYNDRTNELPRKGYQ